MGISVWEWEGMVMKSRHSSVYLLVTSRENYWSKLHENFTTDVQGDEEEVIKF